MGLPVLIIGHADGYIEAYGPAGVSIHTAIVPATHRGDAEILAETFVRNSLPGRYAAIWQPGNMRCSDNIRQITVEDIRQHQDDMALLRSIHSIQQQSNESGVTCVV